MSYCRFAADSSVYVYQDVDFGLRCCACQLPARNRGSFDTRSRREMIAHLEAHLGAGQKVPVRVITSLRAEIEKLGDDAPGKMHLEMDRAEHRTNWR